MSLEASSFSEVVVVLEASEVSEDVCCSSDEVASSRSASGASLDGGCSVEAPDWLGLRARPLSRG